MSRPKPPGVTLSRLNVNDIVLVMRWVNDPAVMGYFANRQEPISLVDELAYIEKIVESPTDRVWSVCAAKGEKNAGDYIGQCSINQIYWPARNGRVFLVVTKEHQGKGYGEAMLEALKKEAWAMGLHKLWLIVREDNLVAQSHYVKAGFKFEGTLKDEYCVAGKFYNMVRMAILNPND